jgi:2-C-methyl-D-erythritol 4-phosphate cytidylyltransferase
MARKIGLVIPAAGTGTRFAASMPKQFLALAGKPVLAHSLALFSGIVDEAVIAVAQDARARVAKLIAEAKLPFRCTVIEGGITRMHSVAAALKATHKTSELILVHDAVRPLTPRASIEACLSALSTHKAAVVAIPCSSTVKRARTHKSEAMVETTVPRTGLWLAQTPQGFHREIGLPAFEHAAKKNWGCSDDSEVLERCGVDVAIVLGDARNIKITTPDDFALAEAMLKKK